MDAVEVTAANGQAGALAARSALAVQPQDCQQQGKPQQYAPLQVPPDFPNRPNGKAEPEPSPCRRSAISPSRAVVVGTILRDPWRINTVAERRREDHSEQLPEPREVWHLSSGL